jgi:hypothetical protein
LVARLPAHSGEEHARRRLLHRRDHLAAAAVRALFIEIDSRRVHLAGCTANPTGAWVTQQARQFAWTLAERSSPLRFLIRDRDSKFTRDFDTVFRSEGIEIIRTPMRAPKANAIAERLVRTVRSERLDWLLIVNRHHLERVLRVFVDHYNSTVRSTSNRPTPLHGSSASSSRRLPTSSAATASAASFTNTGSPPEPSFCTPQALLCLDVDVGDELADPVTHPVAELVPLVVAEGAAFGDEAEQRIDEVRRLVDLVVAGGCRTLLLHQD